MKTAVMIFIAFVVVHAVSIDESGYLVTSPRIFRAGSTQQLSVSLFSVSVPWVVNATVSPTHGAGDSIASDGAQFTGTSDGLLKLKIPKDLGAGNEQSIKAILSVFGGPVGEPLTFEKNELITIEIPKSSIFIQTDKPIYKPGQTVNVRIVGADENLKPLTGKLTMVTITGPSGVRTMQWTSLDFVVGIVSLKFPLSSQPVLGDWKIEATHQGEKKTLVFKVDKYVLPKFKVTILPPSFVANTDSTNITATICARYMYEQPVKGKVSVLFKLTLVNWEAQTTVEKEINGCSDVSVSPKLFGLKLRSFNFRYSGGKLAIDATVKEAATGVSQNATGTETEIVKETTKVEFLPTTPTVFKPGMPFTGQVKATLIDGSPLKGKSVQIVVKSVFRKRFTIPANGIVDFVVPGSKIPQMAKSLSLEVLFKGKRSASHKVGKRWYSPSNSYIEMEKIFSPLKVESTSKVMFDFTSIARTKNITFHYQVFSRGNLVVQGRKIHPVDYKSGMKTLKNSKNEEMFTSQGFIEFDVTQKMVPSCRLLLFYVRDDQETVADNMLIDIEDSLENKVNVRFADSVRKPGESTRLIITAAPGSLVAVAAVDKSVQEENELTLDDAINVLSSQDLGPSGDYHSCYVSNRKGSKPLDASKAFKDGGAIYFSNLKIETAECVAPKPTPTPRPSYRYPYWGWPGCIIFSFRRRRWFVGHQHTVHRGQLSPLASADRTGGVIQTKKPERPKEKSVYVRKQFPETWLWIEQVVNEETGKTMVMAKVPDTITSWVASAFAMSHSAGLGVSKPTSLKVFQPFLVSLTYPHSAIRGEEVSIIATVFNYESKCLTIRLDLEDSLNYRILSNASYEICVCSNEAKSVRFNIVPKKLGQIPLPVVAKDVDSSACGKDIEQMTLGVTDYVIKKLLVEPEGIPQEYTYNSFVCLKDESSFHDTIEIALPKNVIPGSVYTVVSTVGDLMGPTLNVGSLLRLPYGCGEQNMVNFAPSVYIMKYLSTVGQLTPSVENKAKTIMTTGYQRELTYKRTDGSYSAFGNSDDQGSMWLTAFVLRSFAQARPFIFVDQDELIQTAGWITKKQQQPSGCFPKYGELFNKQLKGGISTEATLTAFVAVSLMESGLSPQDQVIQDALKCLRAAYSNLTESYSLALFAYTFALAENHNAMVLFRALERRAIKEDGFMHWEKQKKTNSHQWSPYYRAPSADIETTAYALVTYVLLAEDDPALIGQAMPIVRWLTKQRNALGGFVSTQDTCIALQALSRYASKVYSNATSLAVQFGNENNQTFYKTFRITASNRLVSQRAQVPSSFLPISKLPVEVQGEGCALIQADVSYNIPDLKKEPAFDLKVTLKRSEDVLFPVATETGEFLCLPLDMFISAKWLREDSSNMAVIDVKLVSGYEANEESLDRLTNNPSLGFKRYEIEGQHLILYFDEIDKVSFSFKIYQSTMVKKTKPASVTVYDYYETHFSTTVMYEITEDICGADPIPISTSRETADE